VVAHARMLGAYLQGCADTEHLHTPEAVMRDIAVTREF